MSNKDLNRSIFIGVVAAVVLCLIFIYIENENNNRLVNSNDFFKDTIDLNSKRKPINVHSVPQGIKKELKENVLCHEVAKNRQSYRESIEKIQWLKQVIENRGGYKLLYKNGLPFTKEKDIHIFYDFTWAQTKCDINKEVNNGTGHVDFKVSFGLDQTLIEFKLASNTHLRKNIEKQLDTYAIANNSPEKIMVIIFTKEKQELRVKKILKDLNYESKKNIILIDARNDNKLSASVA